MLAALLISLGVVFLAELGDKSQLITMTYALRYHWSTVLSGVAIAAFVVHGVSVTLGHYLGSVLPERPVAAAAGLAYLCFAIWTWRDSATAGLAVASMRTPRFALFAVVSSMILAELGDKTMLATVALASDHNWLGVWVGATAGMVLADAAAIGVGTALHRRLPEHLLHGSAALLFAAFGLWMLIGEVLDRRPVAVAVIVIMVSVAVAGELRRVVREQAARARGADPAAR